MVVGCVAARDKVKESTGRWQPPEQLCPPQLNMEMLLLVKKGN